MKRYYSHYTFIYPNTLLEKTVFELNEDGFIERYFPFDKEIANTEFHSGILIFIPEALGENQDILINKLATENEQLALLLSNGTDYLVRSFRV
ncbi:hypothetical protein D0T53_01510 [Dysgonomonas sp. 216]|uniref:hypothetical protein n=1 Tax=Dysgonomonas sp. 216 TaxID=2302934 RepID=UPI0013D29BE8|nr:hypothetical protein [Dysgonomonas sp. 216]NDW17592.1 hypothetical protein [Dysgonomonas sp. 216]